MEELKSTNGQDEPIGVRNKKLGNRGEIAASYYLELIGYDIVDRNWTCPAGEADIIAWDEDYLVFCEVKTRTSLEKGFPCEAITKKKRHKYELIAAWYLKDHDYLDVPIRFDVIDLLVVASDRAMIRHLKNAFGVF